MVSQMQAAPQQRPLVFGQPPGATWQEQQVLVTVKTYPNPSGQYTETVCTAGVTEDGRLIRVYPISFRMLDGPKQFKKYQWVKARLRKATKDVRAESHNIDEDSIVLVGNVDTKRNWEERKRLVLPHLAASIEVLQDDQAAAKRSLGLIRPKEVKRFIRQRQDPKWTPTEIQKLTRTDFLRMPPDYTLEKLPWKFGYEFTCDDVRCTGHRMQVLDWEVAQSFRQWRRDYGESGWWDAMQKKYFDELVNKCDLHFYMGTLAGHQTTWTIVGLFYPRKGT